MAIVGTARLHSIEALIPAAAWRAHHRSLGLARPS
jgi:hypothetical protein